VWEHIPSEKGKATDISNPAINVKDMLPGELG